MDLEEILKKKSICTNEFFFITIFQSTFFFLKYKEISVIFFFCNPNDVEVSKTYIRYDTLPRLKMVIE